MKQKATKQAGFLTRIEGFEADYALPERAGYEGCFLRFRADIPVLGGDEEYTEADFRRTMLGLENVIGHDLAEGYFPGEYRCLPRKRMRWTEMRWDERRLPEPVAWSVIRIRGELWAGAN